MIKDRDVRRAIDTLISEVEAQESQIEYLNKELDLVLANNHELLDKVEKLEEANMDLLKKIENLEQALVEAHLTSKE